jgi:hypothetical protein
MSFNKKLPLASVYSIKNSNIMYYICIVIGDPIIKRERVGIPLTGLTPPPFCACPK